MIWEIKVVKKNKMGALKKPFFMDRFFRRDNIKEVKLVSTGAFNGYIKDHVAGETEAA